PVVFAALVGGIVWDLIKWWFGIPSSSSHALIGGLAGAGVAKAGAGVLDTAGSTLIGVSIVLSPLLGLVLGFNDAGVLDVPALHAHAGGHALPPRAARVGGALQPGPRRQRRPEDDGRHRRPALRQRNARAGLLRSAVGRARLPRRDGTRDALGRVADRADDGTADHEAQARRRVLRRDRWRRDAVPRDRSRHSGVHHAHHHGRDRGRGVGDERVGRAMGSSGTDRLGVGPDDPVLRLHRRPHLGTTSLTSCIVRPTLALPIAHACATTMSSGYAGIPNSGTSSPSSSTAAETRRGRTAFTSLKTTKVAPKA